MGLFSTVLHVYRKSQSEIVFALSEELRQNYNFTKFTRLVIKNSNYEQVLDKEVFHEQGVFYLITQLHGDWSTILELDVNLGSPIFLYELANNISCRLNTYTLSFHLHDDDVMYYNLDRQGASLDGYNSDYQYFEAEPVSRGDIISQRHKPASFVNILPKGKSVEGLNSILNEGIWEAFDNADLDEKGIPNDYEKYLVDELDRFERIGKYLEIFSPEDYPFAGWYSNLPSLVLENCYLLKAEK